MVAAVDELVRLGATCSRWLVFCSVLLLEYSAATDTANALVLLTLITDIT